MLARIPLLTLALLAGTVAGADASGPKRLLLIGQSPDSHPPKTHEYMQAMKLLEKCLGDVPGLELTVAKADEPWKDGPGLIARADGVVVFVSEGARWLHQDPERLKALNELAARKGGVSVLHWGMGTKSADHIDGAVDLFGGCHGGPTRKYKVLETAVRVADPKHPVTTGIRDFRVEEEFYYKLHLAKAGRLQPLLRADIDGNLETVAWAWERPDGGRSFGFSGLHFHDNWLRPEYQRLITQGILWTLDLPRPEGGLAPVLEPRDLYAR